MFEFQAVWGFAPNAGSILNQSEQYLLHALKIGICYYVSEEVFWYINMFGGLKNAILYLIGI